MRNFAILAAVIVQAGLARAELSVTVSQPEIAGRNAVVPIVVSNSFGERIESARAVVFLVNKMGTVVAQSSKWVIGGSKDAPGLPPGATKAFYFVVSTGQPLTTATNFVAKLSFSRIILEGGRLVDVRRDVRVTDSR